MEQKSKISAIASEKNYKQLWIFLRNLIEFQKIITLIINKQIKFMYVARIAAVAKIY